jgi:SPP1 family predicted phage head-tail adaptor
MTRYRINPGEYRHVIEFESLENVSDSYGAPFDRWLHVLKTRAAIYPISGKEFYAAETVNSEVSHKVNMRYMPGITPDLRIKFGDRFFSIISIINFQEKNIQLQLLCKELI